MPDWLKFQVDDTEWLEMIDCDTVGTVFQTVEVTTCPPDVKVVLAKGGWLRVTVFVVALRLVCEASVEPVVTVIITTVPEG